MTPPDLPQNVTYTEHIKPILQKSCYQCHSYKPYNWTTYENVYKFRDRIRLRVVGGTMPPGQFLPERDRQIIKKWVDTGAKE